MVRDFRPLEEQYYEFDGFWNPDTTALGDFDRRRVEDIFSLVPTDVMSILDAGCGSGIFCNYAQDVAPHVHVVGCDRSQAALSYVQVSKAIGNVAAMPFATRAFDCVTSLEVLEHLPIIVYDAACLELTRLARKYSVISVPHNQRLGKGLTECPACRTRFDPDLHLRSFNSEKMQYLFAEHGFRCAELREIGVYSWYKGISLYAQLRSLGKGRISKMASPICPLCGYQNEGYFGATIAATSLSTPSRSSTIRQRLKRIWPRQSASRWLAALYVRIQ